MKLRTTFLMRCLAFAMALVLVITGSGLGQALQVFAIGEDRTVLEDNVGSVLVNNYRNELTDAEIDLLDSGLLNAEHIHYTAPNNDDGLVAIDEVEKTVTAASYADGHGHTWTPKAIRLKVGDATVETGAIVDGKYTYEFDGNAFSVEVDYALDINVTADVQNVLLNTGFWLKEGVAYADAVAGQMGNLYILEEAMPELYELVMNGVSANLPGGTEHVEPFPQEIKDAVAALNEQMTANDGVLNLSVIINAYDAVPSTYYVLDKGTVMYEEAVAIADDVAIIADALDKMIDDMSIFIAQGWVTETQANQLNMLSGVTRNLAEGLAAVEGQTWTAAEKGTVLIAAGADCEKLDELVAALGEQSEVEIKEDLNVTNTILSANLSMFNVTFKVVLNVVEDVVNSAELIEYGYSQITMPLLKDATAEDILASIASTNVEADALALWTEEGVFAAEHFEAVKTELPETLTEDITYVITYSPKNYTITMDYADALVVPYGYKYMLPVHTDAAQSYDYKVDGVSKAQGAVITIVGDTQITRTAGKAYTATTLYEVVADNYGDDIAKAILTSGALKGNEDIFVRKPDPADAESLLTLMNPDLTAENYDASYMGLEWVPYTYGTEGTEHKFVGNAGTWTGKSVKVQYRLNLTNYTADDVDAILALARTLKTEANAQKSALDGFAANYETMGQLDKTKLGALNGVIGVTDFTPGDGTDTDARNLELRAYFADVVGKLINDHVDSNNYLKIYNMLGQYNVNGLRYYYNNAQALIDEINAMAGYLGDMVKEQEALEIMVNAAGFPEYVEKIANLEESLASVQASLTVPNAKIDLKSENLGKLLDALTVEGVVTAEKIGVPYLLSDMLTALDDTTVMIQVIIDTPNGTATVTSDGMDRHTVVTQPMVNDLVAKVEAKVTELLKGNNAFYTESVQNGLQALVGNALSANHNAYYTYSVKNFTVKIDGEADQTISIKDLEINLPKHPTTGWKYEYTVDGVDKIVSDTYTFTTEQVLRLFVDGTYTITRVAINEGEEKLETTFGDWLIRDGEGNLIKINASVSGDKTGIVDNFVMKIVNSGYTYIALNGEPLMYLNDANELEICLQTLVNAILKDNTFGRDTLIDLGKNGKGQLVAAKMSLGNAADDILYEDVPFVLELTSVPGMMGTVSKGLEKISPYIDFNSVDGVLDIDLTLPEKVYEAYLAALLVTGNLDKNDLDAINSEIAFQFLWDYVDIVRNTEADAQTFTNTLAMLGQNYDLTGYDKYYQMVKKALNNNGLVINPEDDNDDVNVSVTGKGQKGINALINLLGIDISGYTTYLGMIKEYKDAEAELTASAVATLTNTAAGFQAAVIDVRASGITNKADFTKNLPARIAQITKEGAVMLVGDVTGDLVIPAGATVILDLNGFKVTGSIVANGTLIIVDSSIDSANCGHVTGSVSGNVTVIAGVYDADVTAFLKDGYKQNADGAVTNALYTIVSDGQTITFEINSDVMDDPSVDGYVPNARALAVDIAVDLILNSYTAAALTVEGDLYHVDIQDVIALVAGTNRIDTAIQTVLDFVDVPGMGEFVNSVLADLVDFNGLYNAFKNDDVFASYNLKKAPWELTVKRVTDEDYITFGIGNNQDLAKEYTVALKLVGENKNRVLNLLKELADHVDVNANVDLKQPTYDGAANDLFVEGSAELNVTLKFRYDEYRTIVAVVLANGNPEKAEALIAALNTGKQAELKEEIDKISIEDIFTALKALNRNESFAELCEKLGVEVDTAEAERVENLYHIFLCAAGKVLETLDITGRNSVLGGLDKDDDGIYVWSHTVTRKPDASFRGYTVYAEASATVTLTLELFDECEHDNTITKTENVVPADCVNPGSHDVVVYCADCGIELSRETVVDPALGHKPGDVVIENKVDAKCGVEGHYDEVVYCSVCGEELSRNTVTVPALDHVPGAPVYENVVAPDCDTPGSHDEVIYCEVCGEELERKTVHDSALGHEWGEWTVVEEPTCEKVGKKERVCSVCGEVESETLPIVDHTPAEAVKENEVPANCTEAGSYDEVIYCSVCGHEISRETVTVPALGHVPAEAVKENEVPASCGVEGSYDEVIYCSVCGEELSRQTITTPALEHVWGEWKVVVPADIGVPGLKQRVCQRCGEIQEEVIPALDAPPTGDEFAAGLYITLMVLSVIGMGVLAWFVIAMKKTGRYSSK